MPASITLIRHQTTRRDGTNYGSRASPISSYWNLLRTEQDCISETATLLSHAIAAIMSDLLVWALPLPALYRAKLPLSQRIALIVLFSFGLVVILAACIRTYYIHVVVQVSYDVTWDSFYLWIWTSIEMELGIICGCVPWLKSLFKVWQTKRAGTRASGSTGANSRTLRSDGRSRKTMSDAGAVYRMDNRRKYSNPTRNAYLDLESCPESAGSRASSPGPALTRPAPAR